MDHQLFDHSPIVRRPRVELPDGKRLAVWVGINVEHYRFGQQALSLAPFTAQLVPDPLNHGWRDYGARVGLWRLADLLQRHGFPVSAITNSAVFEHYPEVAEEGRARGWAWVGHGVDNSSWWVGMGADDERAALKQIVSAFEGATGAAPRGWLGPALTSTENTTALLAELGFSYSLDWANDDQPYPLNVPSGRLLSLPYASEVNDIPAFVIHHHTGEQFAQSVVDQFDQLYEEGADSLRVMGIGLHPFLVGQPFRARAFARALEHIASHDDVWLATSDEIADWALGALPAAAAGAEA
jgi:peptidoglycan/xylan/chitin deacetylase (PgdA/CDA1 family)